MKQLGYYCVAIAALVTTIFLWADWDTGRASSHREAPLMMLDPTADLTDVFIFRDPNDTSMVNLYMNVIPFQDPAGGPNFYRFDPLVLYAMNIDNNGDAVPDIVYEFRFEDAIQNENTFLYNTGPIESIDDPDYNFRQTYSVTRVDSTDGTSTTLATGLITPPENIGPKSTPNYDALAQQAVYDIGDGRVFVGQRDDPFFVDLGALFDLLEIRGGPPGNTGGGVDGLGGFNVHTIALQLPISDLTADGEALSGDDPDAVIGIWATTSRPSMIIFDNDVLDADGIRSGSGEFIQISRLGNPLVNEVIVPLGFKNFFLNSKPRNDLENYGDPEGPIFDPELARLLSDLYGINVPPAPRDDLTALLTGIEGVNMPMNAPDGEVVPADLLRINLGITPVSSANAQFSRMGVLGDDLGGYPNGRRLEDDVTDILLQIVAGVLVEEFNVAPNNLLGDGVPFNDRPSFLTEFPYMATPYNGFEHDHHRAGLTSGTHTEGEDTGYPQAFGLFQNYPNPFNPSTTIEYDLNHAGPVRIEVYDVQGRLIATLFDGDQTAGKHRVTWDGTNNAGVRVASGTYLYRVHAEGAVRSRKMVLVK